MSAHLRPYQIACVDAIFDEWTRVQATCIEAATGVGKSEIFAEVIRRAQPRRALVLADRRKLVTQAAERIERRTGLTVGIEMGLTRAKENLFSSLHAVVSSVQSQTAGRRFPSSDFDFLILDESHLVKPKNKQVMEVIAHYKKNSALKILGVTATLEADNLLVFESVAFRYPILQAVQEGYLVNIKQKLIHCGTLDYSHVRTVAGELCTADLAAVVEKEKPCMEMCQATLEAMFDLDVRTLHNVDPGQWGEFLKATGRKPKSTLMFTASVAHAEMLCNIFQRVMPGQWAWVCGDNNLTSEDRRYEIDLDFASGKLAGVCQCDIWSKGYDNPRIEIIGMGRATKSLTRYKQQAGRGTRILPGVIDGLETDSERLSAIATSAKKCLTILDFVDNSRRHSLCTVVDIVAPDASSQAKSRAKSKAEKSGKPENMADLVRASEEEILKEREERQRRALEEAARKQRLVAKNNYAITEVDVFARLNVRLEPPSLWEKRQGIELTGPQKEAIRKMGVDPDKISVSCGRKLLGARGPSPAQAYRLKNAGYDPAQFKGAELKRKMHKLAANNWQRLPEDIAA